MNVKTALRAAIVAYSYEKVLAALIEEGVSSRAAERLCDNDYKHEPKALKSKIETALARVSAPGRVKAS